MYLVDLLFRRLQGRNVSHHLILSCGKFLDDVPHDREVARHRLKLVL